MIDNIELNFKDFNDIYSDSEFLKKLRKLTLYSWSGLNYELNHLISKCNFRKVDASIITASIDGLMVGWALCSREKTDYCFKTPFDPLNSVLFEVFVDERYRRRGIGSEIMRVARRKYSNLNICVAPWDDTSNKFFKKFDSFNTKKIHEY
jgi:GNAT superfamily N-acetyltransferase